jgi:hypothetical protein
VADEPPRSEVRYVDYDAAHDLVAAARYRVGMVRALPTYFALGLASPLGPNLIDGVRLRAEARLRAGLAHWTLTEREGHHELVAWKRGPVRVVRRSRHQVHLGLGIYLTAGIAHTYFYPLHVFGPGSMKLPFSPQVLFSDIHATGGVDFRDLSGWRYHAPGTSPDGFAINGRTSDAERAFAGHGTWFLLRRGREAVLVVTTMSENLARGIPIELVYLDDATRSAPPEFAPGSQPLVGYRGSKIERLESDRYWFQLRVLGFTDYRDGDETLALRRLDAPLTAEVSAPTSPAAAPAARP